MWLVGITNAFNLLDNMDGLAASLAAVSCAVFAVDAIARDSGELGLVVALALGGACVGFLPFNLRPGKRAAVFMGDSGSQLIGFGLAGLALASSWTTAGATLTSVLLPLLVLAIPILDTTLVTVRRTLDRRPVTQGGTDHTSHRLVYYGLSEQQAVLGLTSLAALLGATGLAYTVLGNPRVTAVGVLVSFVVLVQFASFLGDLEERSRRAEEGPTPSLWRALISNPRRLVEVLVDFAIICASFLGAYLLFVDGEGTPVERAIFLSALPVLLAVRYVLFVLFGIYRRVWRFASARDLVAIAAAVVLSVPVTVAIVARTQTLQGFPLEIFLVDALLCMTLIAGSRLALRLLPLREGGLRSERTRVLIVGAGRSGRALARELAETPDRRVVGFLDDNPSVRRRRVLGVKVLGGLDEAAAHIGAARPDEVLVTIPDVAAERLHAVQAASASSRRPLPARPADDRAEPRAARRGVSRVTASARRRRLRLPELETLLPLLAAYVVLAALYAWQAWQRQTPTLFSDEIEFTQISRSIAETGRAALRGGEPAHGISLYAYLAAPAWWLDQVETAYSAVKLLGVLLMTAAIFPAYALARLVVTRPYALFAAIATAAAPALSYSPFLVEEPLAYPVSTLALFLIARAGIAPTRWSVGLATAACLAAVLVRTQLAVLLPVLALVLGAHAWRRERLRDWRATWSSGDWLGAAVLAVGVAIVLSAALGHRSYTWYVATSFLKGQMLEYGLWAAGALAIGIGVLPLVAGLTALVRPRSEAREEGRVAFVDVTVAAIVAFGLYTAIKSAYLSTTFAIVVAERNLIYLYPLLFTGTALLLARRRASLVALAGATAFALYLVSTTPYTLAQYPNYEAHGLAIAAFANRILHWPDATIETTLVLLTLASALVLAALRFVRVPRLASAAVCVVAAFVVGWSLTTEIYAANGERAASDQVYANLPKPPDWVDLTTHGEPTIYVGQGIDAPAAWQVEFWNPNVRWFWGMDGSAPGPGERRTPNLLRPDGTQDPADLNAGYALAVNGVQIAAPEVTTVGGAVLYRLDGAPVRLRQTTTGVSQDGWMGKNATYTRYDVRDDGPGFVKVRLSREAWCSDKDVPARATVLVGPVGVNEYDQPAIARVTARGETTIRACEAPSVLLRVPDAPWRAEVSVDKTFVPRDLDPNVTDPRELSARPTFEFVPLGTG